MSQQTLDQQRAAYAWASVAAVESVSRKELEEYRDLVRKLPSMVQTNGFGQALAFLLVQKGAKRKLYVHLENWLCKKSPHLVYAPQAGEAPDLMLSVANGSSLSLRRATLEVQTLAVWLKRFAEARENTLPPIERKNALPPISNEASASASTGEAVANKAEGK